VAGWGSDRLGSGEREDDGEKRALDRISIATTCGNELRPCLVFDRQRARTTKRKKKKNNKKKNARACSSSFFCFCCPRALPFPALCALSLRMCPLRARQSSKQGGRLVKRVEREEKENREKKLSLSPLPLYTEAAKGEKKSLVWNFAASESCSIYTVSWKLRALEREKKERAFKKVQRSTRSRSTERKSFRRRSHFFASFRETKKRNWLGPDSKRVRAMTLRRSSARLLSFASIQVS